MECILAPHCNHDYTVDLLSDFATCKYRPIASRRLANLSHDAEFYYDISFLRDTMSSRDTLEICKMFKPWSRFPVMSRENGSRY
jgi:hypothetical protein